MSRKNKAGKRKDKIVINEKIDISEERLTEIYAETYYRALKRIEYEREVKQEQKSSKVKKPWYAWVGFWLNIFLFPFKLNKRIKFNGQLYDGLLVVIISTVLEASGALVWFCGCVNLVYECYNMFAIEVSLMQILKLVIGGVFVFAGSFLFIVGKQFGKETESNRIYAYSACVLALVGCIVSIVALLKA